MNTTATPHLPGSRPGTVLVPQGPLTRGPAFLVDTFLVSILVALVLGSHTPLLTLILATMAAEFIYFSVCEGVAGTTLGKRIFGLRVVRAADGRPCGPFAAVVRTVLRLVDNILLSLPGITFIVSSPRRQRLGDRAAKTLVVSEVPEQLLAALGGLPGQGAASAEDMMKHLNELAQQQAAALGAPPLTVTVQPDGTIALGAPTGTAEDTVPCPFCDEPMSAEEIVCRHCDHYVNQVSAHGETEDMAPLPELYSEDRNLRFDAVWRLVFAGGEESLGAVREAVAAWPQPDRLLAVHMFSEVGDLRPVAFLDFMTHDPDAAVAALARDVRERLSASV